MQEGPGGRLLTISAWSLALEKLQNINPQGRSRKHELAAFHGVCELRIKGLRIELLQARTNLLSMGLRAELWICSDRDGDPLKEVAQIHDR